MYLYYDIFMHMFQPVILPSLEWHFCYKNTVWSNVTNFYTILIFIWILI